MESKTADKPVTKRRTVRIPPSIDRRARILGDVRRLVRNEWLAKAPPKFDLYEHNLLAGIVTSTTGGREKAQAAMVEALDQLFADKVMPLLEQLIDQHMTAVSDEELHEQDQRSTAPAAELVQDDPGKAGLGLL